jgi:competence protein ComEC
MLSNLFIGFGLNRKKVFWLIVLAIIFFVIITGSPPSIVRAGVMGVVALIASSVGRAGKMHNLLAIVALIMLLVNPKILIWDAGFQLSFLATIGLIYFSPIMQNYTGWLPSIFQIRESLTTTLSAIILTMPLTIYQFGRFSLIAPIANLLVLPAIPINMAVGFLAVAVGFIYPPCGQIIGYGSWLLLTYILKVIEFLANLKFSSITIEFFPWWLMAASYIIIGYSIINYQKKADE